jgi:creatinine amidohydrolase/Fe(II)-dependent formamide hydrolase-like protein
MAVHDYASMTWEEIREIAAANPLAILPIGSIEQHGPHLPVGTDSYIAKAYAEKSLEAVTSSKEFLLLPQLYYALSVEHTMYPGTITLTATTLLNVVTEIGDSLFRSGIKKLMLINGHGGNEHILHVAAREIKNRNRDMDVYILNKHRLFADIHLSEYSIHADNYETSLMMYLHPEKVRDQKITKDLDDSMGLWDQLADKSSFLYETWFADGFSVKGVIGDPYGSTPEQGEAYLSRLVSGIAAAITYAAENK